MFIYFLNRRQIGGQNNFKRIDHFTNELFTKASSIIHVGKKMDTEGEIMLYYVIDITSFTVHYSVYSVMFTLY